MIKNSFFSFDNKLYYIYIIILIIILVIIFLFYLNKTSNKHYTLYEKYGETQFENHEYLKQNIPTDILPYYYPNQSAKVSLRPCQIRFTSNNSSAYVFKDDWKEFNTITNKDENGNDVVLNYPYKIFTKNGTSNMLFNNFSEESRCFKLKKEDDMKNTYKYKANNLISYNNFKYATFTTAENSKKQYMQMNFNPSLNDKEYHDSALESICSIKYKKVLEPLLQFNMLYFLSINEGNTIDNIQKSFISPFDNNLFSMEDFSLTELLNMNSIIYYYENGTFKFRILKDETPLNIMVYKFERNLICPTEEILSYDKLSLDDTKLNIGSLINVDNLVRPIDIDDTDLPYEIRDNFKTAQYNNKSSLLTVLKTYIDNRITSLNAPARASLVTKRAELTELIRIKNTFADKISTIDDYLKNKINSDEFNYDTSIKDFFNKYLKSGKISFRKYTENKVSEPIITGEGINTNVKNNIKTINIDGSKISGEIITNAEITNPDFLKIYGTNNNNNSLALNGWRIQTKWYGNMKISNKGLASILATRESKQGKGDSFLSFRKYNYWWYWYYNYSYFDLFIYPDKLYKISGFDFYGIEGKESSSNNVRQMWVYGVRDATYSYYYYGRWVSYTYEAFDYIRHVSIPSNAAWNSAQSYRFNKNHSYKGYLFYAYQNWGGSTTSINNIVLVGEKEADDVYKTINFPTNMTVSINNNRFNIVAGDYRFKFEKISKRVLLLNNNNEIITTLNNTTNVNLSYDMPRDLDTLFSNNITNISYNSITEETKEKNSNDNLILLTNDKKLDTYQTFKITTYVYNNKEYIPSIRLYDSNKNIINTAYYKIQIGEYPTDKDKVIKINIYIIIDISIQGTIYLKTIKNNNDLFDINSKKVTNNNIATAVTSTTTEAANSKNIDDLKVIFDITDKEDEIDELVLTIIDKSNFKQDENFRDILSVKRNTDEYEDDTYINRLKKTYNNILYYVNTDESSSAYLNNIDINAGLKIEGKENYDADKYITYQDVDYDMKTPSAEIVRDNVNYDIKKHAKRYIFFTKK
jgi:hypothetical protein